MRKLRQKSGARKDEDEQAATLHALEAAAGEEILVHISQCRDEIAYVYDKRARERRDSNGILTTSPQDSLAELNTEITAEYAAAEERGLRFLGSVANILGFLQMACDGDEGAREIVMRWAKDTRLPDARTIISGPRRNVLPPFLVGATDSDFARSLKTQIEAMKSAGIAGAEHAVYLAGGGSREIWSAVPASGPPTRSEVADWLARALAHQLAMQHDSDSELADKIVRVIPRGSIRSDPTATLADESFDEDAEKVVRAAFRVGYLMKGVGADKARRDADRLFHADGVRRRRRAHAKHR